MKRCKSIKEWSKAGRRKGVKQKETDKMYFKENLALLR